MGIYAAAYIGNDFFQKGIIGKGGASFNFDNDLPVFAFYFFCKISGFADCGYQFGNNLTGRFPNGYQFGNNLTGRFPNVAGITFQKFASVIVARFYGSYQAICIIGNGHFRVYA